MKYGTTKLSDLNRTDNWTPALHLSKSWDDLKEKSNIEIIKIAEELLLSAPEFALNKVISTLKSSMWTLGGIPKDIIDSRRALSTSSHNRLVKSFTERTIISNNEREKLVLSVCIYGALELFPKEGDFLKDAERQKRALLDKLAEVELFIKSIE